MPKASRNGRFPETPEDFTRSTGVVNPREPAKTRDFDEVVREALLDLRRIHGGGKLASFFDGKAGREVAESTVSMWISGQRQFPAANLPTLVELAPDFARAIVPLIFACLTSPAAILAELSPGARAEVVAAQHRAVQSCLWPDVQPRRVRR